MPGTLGRAIGGAINGCAHTGTARGCARGFAAGLILQDLGLKDLYKNNAAANISIGITRDGIRGAIVADSRDGILPGIAKGRMNNAIGHIVGFATTGTLPAFKDGAFVTQGFDRNLMVLTRGAFEQIYQRVMASNLADPLARMLMRMLLGTAQEIELDPDGSIPIGKPLKDFALLAQDAILVGLGDYLEIWSPEQWNKQEEQITNVEANPDSIDCQGLLGRVQMATDQNTAAIESLQRAINLGTTNPRHYLWMGRAQIATGNCPAAVPFLQQSYELSQQQGDTEAVTASADNLAECQAPVLDAVETTPEATEPPT